MPTSVLCPNVLKQQTQYIMFAVTACFSSLFPQLCSVPKTHLLLIFSRAAHILCSLLDFLRTGPWSVPLLLFLLLPPFVILSA